MRPDPVRASVLLPSGRRIGEPRSEVVQPSGWYTVALLVSFLTGPCRRVQHLSYIMQPFVAYTAARRTEMCSCVLVQ